MVGSLMLARRRTAVADIVEFIQCASRNYTAGRQGCAVNTIVVHYTGTDVTAHSNLLYFLRSNPLFGGFGYTNTGTKEPVGSVL